MSEPKNCQCECHDENEKISKHPPHTYNSEPSYTIKTGTEIEKVWVCSQNPCLETKRVVKKV